MSRYYESVVTAVRFFDSESKQFVSRVEAPEGLAWRTQFLSPGLMDLSLVRRRRWRRDKEFGGELVHVGLDTQWKGEVKGKAALRLLAKYSAEQRAAG